MKRASRETVKSEMKIHHSRNPDVSKTCKNLKYPDIQAAIDVIQQLLDLHNPIKPEIVNIPAHSASARMSYANIDHNYGPNASSYVSSPTLKKQRKNSTSEDSDGKERRNKDKRNSPPDARLRAINDCSTVGYQGISPVPPEAGNKNLYFKAQKIAPKHGRPYIKLAALAFKQLRKLDAVYYCTRSLLVSNPEILGKEGLSDMFKDVKREYEQYEKEAPKELRILSQEIGKLDEVWIKPDKLRSGPSEVDKNILSDVETSTDRFITYFLHVHGILFTNDGMETFPCALIKMLKEFHVLLQRSPQRFSSLQFLQLFAINIFSVNNSGLKESGREYGDSSLLQEYSLYTSMVMISMLMDRCQVLHVAYKSSPEYSKHMISDDLARLLPCVKIWTDWMSCQKNLWLPTPSYVLKKINLGFTKTVWTSFADLLNVLQEVELVPLIIHDRKEAFCEQIILEEDIEFDGFMPLLHALQDPTFAAQSFNKDQAKNSMRIHKIKFFGHYICGKSPLYMEFNIRSKRFVSLMLSTNNYESSVSHNFCDELRRKRKPNCNFNGKNCNERDIHGANELQPLQDNNEAVMKKLQERRKAVQAVLHKHQSQRIVLQIKSKYLVPDTNCFIYHFSLIKNLLASSHFQLIIPLVVVNELDGLSRGQDAKKVTSPEHAKHVKNASGKALHFLEEQFSQKHRRIKSITIKGTIMNTIKYRSEDRGGIKGNNDDLILTCCLHLCKDKRENYMHTNHDGSVTLSRNLVLLTDDRDLQLKAVENCIPVRKILCFYKWANL